MFGKREEAFFFAFDDEYEKARTSITPTHKKQECSMCGDVGFPDQLQQCTRCRFRFQHTYCCNSKEGLGTGVWMCDWCQLGTQAARNDRGSDPAASAAACTVPYVSGDADALEFLLKAALNVNEAGVDDAAAAGQCSSVDGGSFCSSSIESVKGDEVRLGGGHSQDASWGSNTERMSEGDEEATTTTTYRCAAGIENNGKGGGGCDPKRNPKLLRCNSKSSQKRRHRSLLEQQCGSVQLKRLSLKGGKSGIACDPPRSFVRRYKSLSDISF